MPSWQAGAAAGHHNRVIAVTTMWPGHWTLQQVRRTPGTTFARPGRDGRGLLDACLTSPAAIPPGRGPPRRIVDFLARSANARSPQRHGPARSSPGRQTRRRPGRGQVSQYLAGDPTWAPTRRARGSPYRQAAITAAMNVPGSAAGSTARSAAAEAAPGYLDDDGRARETLLVVRAGHEAGRTDKLRGAVQAMQPCRPRTAASPATGLLTPSTSTATGPGVTPGPAEFWGALFRRVAGAGDLYRLGRAAGGFGYSTYASCPAA